ncbi:04d91343-a8af-40f7-9644-ef266b6c1f9c [Sclerotinia trifoliorum]|uniref:04d91343-a8af-40f7-9644-ef266b6c1f9c n=1 Tax=Sclerotinia trifoliorum TaxID=28548 RepID=A0A8H2VUX6_9HELO|nr:04d91343-a8af-40f7-9644-ef266b6c1f9c [Sclerotinia trifoliorum]
MCHYKVETCARGHDSSKLSTRVPCYKWQQGVDMSSCQYSAAIGFEEVELRKIQSRICEECVREIFYELKNAEMDEAPEEEKEREEKEPKTSSTPTATRKPSGIVHSPMQEDLKSIEDMESESIQDSPKKQTKGKGGTTDFAKLGNAETSGLPNLQPSSASEPEGVRKRELRRSPRKKQR